MEEKSEPSVARLPALNSSSEQALGLASDRGWGPGSFLLSPVSVFPSSFTVSHRRAPSAPVVWRTPSRLADTDSWARSVLRTLP